MELRCVDGIILNNLSNVKNELFECILNLIDKLFCLITNDHCLALQLDLEVWLLCYCAYILGLPVLSDQYYDICQVYCWKKSNFLLSKSRIAVDRVLVARIDH